jgi:hypothetical protein
VRRGVAGEWRKLVRARSIAGVTAPTTTAVAIVGPSFVAGWRAVLGARDGAGRALLIARSRTLRRTPVAELGAFGTRLVRRRRGVLRWPFIAPAVAVIAPIPVSTVPIPPVAVPVVPRAGARAVVEAALLAETLLPAARVAQGLLVARLEAAFPLARFAAVARGTVTPLLPPSIAVTTTTVTAVAVALTFVSVAARGVPAPISAVAVLLPPRALRDAAIVGTGAWAAFAGRRSGAGS